MPYSMRILVNNFAIRRFRETADKDYIAARMAYRARLIQPFLWSALHCLEKYIKGILVLNRVKAHKGHSMLPGIERMKQHGKFELDLSADTVRFIKKLEDYGAEYRYYEVSYDIEPFDIVRFDHAVWELRRYCQPLDYDIVDMNGKTDGARRDGLLSLENGPIRRDSRSGLAIAGLLAEKPRSGCVRELR